jgi:hypothetical protein
LIGKAIWYRAKEDNLKMRTLCSDLWKKGNPAFLSLVQEHDMIATKLWDAAQEFNSAHTVKNADVG